MARVVPPIDEAKRAAVQAERAAKRANTSPTPSSTASKTPSKISKRHPKSDLKEWEQRPIPDKGDQSKEVTYAALGRAISAWNYIEIALTKMFVTFCEGRGGYAIVVVRAFGSIRSCEARIEMLRAAAEPFFVLEKNRCTTGDNKEYSIGYIENADKEFDKLTKTIKEYMSRRNELAHGIVCPFHGQTRDPITYALQPAPMDKKSDIRSVPLFSYDSKALLYYASKFEELGHDMEGFNIKVRHLRAKPP